FSRAGLDVEPCCVMASLLMGGFPVLREQRGFLSVERGGVLGVWLVEWACVPRPTRFRMSWLVAA
ncbi:MAG: hypothetical protein VW405_14710, partial [Rhodospirillaceae bacterium]